LNFLYFIRNYSAGDGYAGSRHKNLRFLWRFLLNEGVWVPLSAEFAAQNQALPPTRLKRAQARPL
jgi:hypothetical protein